MRLRLTLFWLLIIQFLSYSQTSIEWSKNYGGNFDDNPQSIVQTEDKGYVVAGYSYSKNGDISINKGRADYWILKLDQQGNLVWEKSYGGTNLDYAYEIEQTKDKGFIVIGVSESNDEDVSKNNGNFDVWILKLDKDGELEWENSYGGLESDRAVEIEQTIDDGFIFAGGTHSIGEQGYHGFWVTKLNSVGEVQWEKKYSNGGMEGANSIVQASDGGFLISGSTFITKSKDEDDLSDVWVIKIDENGELIWEKTFGSKAIDKIQSVKSTIDGGYILGGYIIQRMDSDGDGWVIKIDSNGELIWEKTFGNISTESIWALQNTTDGGYILTGEKSDENNFGRDKTWIVKINNNGELIWEKTFGGSQRDYSRNIFQTKDKGYILATYSQSKDGDVKRNNGNGDIWIIKLIPDTSDIERPNSLLPPISVYPNPSNGSFNVQVENPGLEIDIFDSNGQKVESIKRVGSQITIDNLERGIYCLRIRTCDITITEKIIVY